LLPSHFI
jgi:hypothetical protein